MSSQGKGAGSESKEGRGLSRCFAQKGLAGEGEEARIPRFEKMRSVLLPWHHLLFALLASSPSSVRLLLTVPDPRLSPCPGSAFPDYWMSCHFFRG